MAVVVVRECIKCSTRYDLMHWPNSKDDVHYLSQDNEDPFDISCPKCHSDERRKVVTVGQAIWQGGDHGHGKLYPYFDRSLDMEIRSKKHHDSVMKARGLVHCTVDDIERAGLEEKRRNDENEQWATEYDAMLEDDPAYRTYREQRGKGMLVDDIANPIARAKAQKNLMRNDRR